LNAAKDQKQIEVAIIASSTLDNRYSQFVDIFLDFWTNLPGTSCTFTPSIVLVGSQLDLSRFDTEERRRFTIQLECEEGLATQSQVARIASAALSQLSYALLTDIDMLPMRSEYFETLVAKAIEANADFVIARDVLSKDQYPICYTLVNPASLKIALTAVGLSGISLSDIMARFAENNDSLSKADKRHPTWYSDQILLRKVIDNAVSNLGMKKLILTDKALRFRRLDRAYHPWQAAYAWGFLARRGFFSDYHMHKKLVARNLMIKQISAKNE
jgi:hypothetical protein